MKYSEKMSLLLKGVKMDEIRALEAEEAAELEAATKETADESKTDNNEDMKTALESAKKMIEDLEAKLSAKDDENKKLNDALADINNKQTLAEAGNKQATAADVMKELFKSKKEA